MYGRERSGSQQAIVMELVPGPTLEEAIRANAGLRGSTSDLLEWALPIARQLADALEAAHEAGIIHRDLKPANIKVSDDAFVPGAVRPFAESVVLPPQGARSLYAVAEDGRVLAPIAVDRAGDDGTFAGFDDARRSYGVIVNVQELIRRREPAAGR